MEIEGFDNIIEILGLAKELHDIDRYEIVKERFSDVLCWDCYYDDMLSAIASIFEDYQNNYIDDDGIEIMTFMDDVISEYFVHAWEYGKLHNLHYSQNPHVDTAKKEAQRWFQGSCCIDWKLSAYIRTKKAAKQSKLLVLMDTNGCGGCSSYEKVAYGLIRLYVWFKDKCAEFETLKNVNDKPKEDATVVCTKSKKREVKMKVA
jgi:hypothetical protein